MVKYQVHDSNTLDGVKGLLKEVGSSRKKKGTNSVEHLGTKMRIGDITDWGYILLARDGPVELYMIRKGFFVVHLWVNEEEYFNAFRTNRKDAENLFHMTCNMLK